MARVPVVEHPTTREAADHNLRLIRPIRFDRGAAYPAVSPRSRPQADGTVAVIKADGVGFYHPGGAPAMNFSESPPPY